MGIQRTWPPPLDDVLALSDVCSRNRLVRGKLSVNEVQPGVNHSGRPLRRHSTGF